MSIPEALSNLKNEIPQSVKLIAVSKTKPVSDILEAYNSGHRDFGENKVQEMEEKSHKLPKDIRWHMIGHVQRNKVKYMASFVSLIHGVDSLKLLKEINKQAKKHDRVIECLLQIKIAQEDSKFGLTMEEAVKILNSDAFQQMQHVKIIGVMGMATFTDNEEQINSEFNKLQTFYKTHKDIHGFTEVSMGMSGDYTIALEQGSTMIRVGSAIFGERNYS